MTPAAIDTGIRRVRLTDAPSIADIHVRTWQATYRGDLPDVSLDSLDASRREEMWRHAIDHGSPVAATFVAEDSNGNDTVRISGFCHAGPGRDVVDQTAGEIYALYVDPTAQDYGVGAVLMGGYHGLDAFIRIREGDAVGDGRKRPCPRLLRTSWLATRLRAEGCQDRRSSHSGALLPERPARLRCGVRQLKPDVVAVVVAKTEGRTWSPPLPPLQDSILFGCSLSASEHEPSRQVRLRTTITPARSHAIINLPFECMCICTFRLPRQGI